MALGWGLPSLAAEEGPKDGGGIGERGVAAGGALTWGGGSPTCVRAANDGPFHIAV